MKHTTFKTSNNGGRVPVLETRYVDEEMGWAGDWIGRVWQWMSAHDIFIHGGTYLDLACVGDRSLTDIVQGKANRCIRVGKKFDGDLVRWEVERVGASCLCALCSRC